MPPDTSNWFYNRCRSVDGDKFSRGFSACFVVSHTDDRSEPDGGLSYSSLNFSEVGGNNACPLFFFSIVSYYETVIELDFSPDCCDPCSILFCDGLLETSYIP